MANLKRTAAGIYLVIRGACYKSGRKGFEGAQRIGSFWKIHGTRRPLRFGEGSTRFATITSQQAFHGMTSWGGSVGALVRGLQATRLHPSCSAAPSTKQSLQLFTTMWLSAAVRVGHPEVSYKIHPSLTPAFLEELYTNRRQCTK